MAASMCSARRIPRQGDARQFLGLVVRALPRRVPPYGRAVSRLRQATICDRGNFRRRERYEDARVYSRIPAAISDTRWRRTHEGDIPLSRVAVFGLAR